MNNCKQNFRPLVLGYGSIGKCISKALHALQYEVAVAENYYVLDNSGLNFYKADLQCELDFNEVLEDFRPHIVISALPYFLNKRLAEICWEKNLPWLDLGGSVEVSQHINNLDWSNSLCGTDLGLAPGLINIIASSHLKKHKDEIDTIDMYVGGIPILPDIGEPLSYVPTWSIDGLLNEYIQDCEVLENGKIVLKKALDGLEYIHGVYDVDFYEAFYTSGGACHSLKEFQKQGIKNASYRTLRWPGHKKLIKWLLTSGLDKENIGKLINNISEEDKERQNSKVVLVCNLINSKDRKHPKIVKQHLSEIRGTCNFSCMQRATALPVVSVVQLISSGLLSKTGCLTYEDIPYQPFTQNLKALLDNPSF